MRQTSIPPRAGTRQIVPNKPAHPSRGRRKLPAAAATEAQVAVPEAVDVPLPKDPVEQIAIPASINGRDLSQGRP